MAVSFREKTKVRLLLGALERGPSVALRQAALIAQDSLVRQVHLVFRADANAILARPAPEISGIRFVEIPDWEALPAAQRIQLEDPAEAIDWGARDYFDRGWRLWAAMDGPDKVAALGWWRSAAQSPDFFCPMPKNSELLWQTAVLPEYRGYRLHVAFCVSLMQSQARSGIGSFFTNCRHYNTPAHRNILAMGFQAIGACHVSKLTGRRSWHSLPEANREHHS